MNGRRVDGDSTAAGGKPQVSIDLGLGAQIISRGGCPLLAASPRDRMGTGKGDTSHSYQECLLICSARPRIARCSTRPRSREQCTTSRLPQKNTRPPRRLDLRKDRRCCLQATAAQNILRKEKHLSRSRLKTQGNTGRLAQGARARTTRAARRGSPQPVSGRCCEVRRTAEHRPAER